MAESVGTIKQFKGPFSSNSQENYILDLNSNCKVGISIGEKDFMQNSSTDGPGLRVIFQSRENNTVTENEVWIGRTFMYETGEQIDNLKILFPDGAPQSTIVDVVYKKSIS